VWYAILNNPGAPQEMRLARLVGGQTMVQTRWRPFPVTDDDDRFMRDLEDDTEDAPWMSMGDLQFWSASGFAYSLHDYVDEQGLDWYVAAMLPILYRWPGVPGTKQLAPDTMVAFVPDHPRTSYDLEEEGLFPPFVLEVISPSSVGRDEVEKRRAYELLGAQEYALFRPRQGRASTLRGYRRGTGGQFEPWLPDAQGRLWSEVLGLYLVVQGQLVQAQTRTNQLLPTPGQNAAARRQAEAARGQAEAGRQQAEAERQQAEAERQQAESAQEQAEAERQQAEAARQQAEAARQQAEAARQQAEDEQAREAEARRQAEDEIARLRRELERVKGLNDGETR